MLDFGLAKLRDATRREAAHDADARRATHRRGAIIGTVAYMSPEQAEGKPSIRGPTSSRSASCSTRWRPGERPFKGDTQLSMLSSILKDTPPSVTDEPGPAGLRPHRAAVPRQGSGGPLSDREGSAQRSAIAQGRRRERRVSARPAIQSCESQHRGAGPVPADPVTTADDRTGGADGDGYRRRPVYAPRPAPTPAFTTITPMRVLTNTGTARIAAISPDGRYVVHDDGPFDRPSLQMRQVSTSSRVQIVPPMAGRNQGLAFSPDGESVLYVFKPFNDPIVSLFRIPLLGNVPPRKLVEDIETSGIFTRREKWRS